MPWDVSFGEVLSRSARWLAADAGGWVRKPLMKTVDRRSRFGVVTSGIATRVGELRGRDRGLPSFSLTDGMTPDVGASAVVDHHQAAIGSSHRRRATHACALTPEAQAKTGVISTDQSSHQQSSTCRADFTSLCTFTEASVANAASRKPASLVVPQ